MEQFRQIQLPIRTKELRVAVGRNSIPISNSWRFWVNDKNGDIFLSTRNMGKDIKVTVHNFDHIHFKRDGDKEFTQMAPPILMGNGKWLHLIELRFLVGKDAFIPKQDEKSRKVMLANLSEENMLILNLFVGNKGTSLNEPLPPEFNPTEPLWKISAKGRPVILSSRIGPIDDHNADQIRYYRYELNPEILIDKDSISNENDQLVYMELHSFEWHQTNGNIILIIPRGKEAIRIIESKPKEPNKIDNIMQIDFSSPEANIEIPAPNGEIIAILSINNNNGKIDLEKNKWIKGILAEFTLKLNPEKIIVGESFMKRQIKLTCVPTVDGVKPRNWNYVVEYEFNGNSLIVNIHPLSIKFLNKNYPQPMNNVKDSESINFQAPFDFIKLETNIITPQASASIESGFLLLDSIKSEF